MLVFLSANPVRQEVNSEIKMKLRNRTKIQQQQILELLHHRIKNL